jgi:hypothetical protein
MSVRKNRVIDSGFRWIFGDPAKKSALRKEIMTARVKVGVIAGTERGDEQYDNGLTVAENALIHEFGTDTIPARSFARSAYDEEREDLAETGKKLAVAIIKGRITTLAALDVLGAKLARAMKNKILAGIDPPLSPITLERRRRERAARPLGFLPLIDTKRLVRAISWLPIIGGKEIKGRQHE